MDLIKLFALVLGMSVSLAYAAPSAENPDFYPYDPIPYSGASYVFCRADTVCPNGLPVGCYAYGSGALGAACTWVNYPGAYVECTGFNDLGVWATSWARCY